jgi:hypothetical protein
MWSVNFHASFEDDSFSMGNGLLDCVFRQRDGEPTVFDAGTNSSSDLKTRAGARTMSAGYTTGCQA